MKNFTISVLLAFALVITTFANVPCAKHALLPEGTSFEGQKVSSVTPNRTNNPVTFEDFEGEIYPPYGWKATSGGEDYTFFLSRKGTYSGTHCVANTNTDVIDPHRLLITPKLAISEGNSIVSIWISNHQTPFPQPYDVLVSTTGNEPEDFSIFEEAPDPGNAYVMKSFDFAAYNGQEIYVAFRPTTTHKYALYIDDVSLPTIVFPYENDLAVTNILPTAIPFGQFIPQVVITNYGNAAVSNFSVELSDGGAYNEVVNVNTTIESSGRITLEFPMHDPAVGGSKVFTATVNFAADENSENNSYNKNIYMYAPLFEQHELVNIEGAHATGADVSMLLETQTGLGQGFNFHQRYLLADDFIIPEGDTWTVDGFRFFGFQTESSLESSLYAGYIRIYKGRPNAPGSELIADFGEENMLISSNFINAYRIVAHDYENTQRPLMDMICRIPEITLEEGEYWVAIGSDGSLDKPNGPQTGPFNAHLQFKDGNPETGNAVRIFMNSVSDWKDNGIPQGLPFDVFGSKLEKELPAPRNLSADINEQDVTLSWQEPIFRGGHTSTAINAFEGSTFKANATSIGSFERFDKVESSGTPSPVISEIKHQSGSGLRNLLWDNGPFVNAPGQGAGGADVSHVHSGQNTYESNVNYAGNSYIADDFEVDEVWEVDNFTFYAYQTGSTTASSFTGGYLQILDGAPDAGGQVVWGDETTNLMVSTSWTNAYRTSQYALTNTDRPIMQIVCATPGLVLQPGVYWVTYALSGSIASGPWIIPVTISGQLETGNAKQLTADGWIDLHDDATGAAFGTTFIIEGDTGGGGTGDYNLLGYNVYRDGELIGNTASNIRTFIDTSLESGTYTYAVTAVYDEPTPGESEPITLEVIIEESATMFFEEPWTSGGFTENQWSFEPEQGNWTIITTDGQPAPAAQFGYSPTQTDYSFSLISKEIDATASRGFVTFEFDLYLLDYANNANEKMIVSIWNGGSWVELETIANHQHIQWTTYSYDVTAHAMGKITKVKFEATGVNTWDFNFWRIDNIKLFGTAGPTPEEPIIAVNPTSLNETLEPNQTSVKQITVTNIGSSALEFELEVNTGRGLAYFDNNRPSISIDQPKLDRNLFAKANKSQHIASPNRSTLDEVIRYDNGIYDDAIGLTNGGTFEVAAYWPASSMAQYAGMELEKVEIYINDVPSASSLKIYGQGTSSAPGALLHTQSFTSTPDTWLTVELDTPVAISGQDIWIAYEVTHGAGEFPPGADAGPAVVGFGDMIGLNGAWDPVSVIAGFNVNWNIAAYLVEGSGPIGEWLTATPLSGVVEGGASVTIDVNFDATGLSTGSYEGSLVFNSNDPSNPVVTVPVTLQVSSSNICYPVPRNLTDIVEGQDVTLNWQIPNLNDGRSGIDTFMEPENRSHSDNIIIDMNPIAVGSFEHADISITTGTPDAVIPGIKYQSGSGSAVLLFDNGPFINAPGQGAGGKDVSHLHSGLNTYGPNVNFAGDFFLADDFTVDETWMIENFTFYAYQTGSGNTSTFTGGYVQIINATPDAGGEVVWGDMTTNRMISTSWVDAYRTAETTINNTDRPIMEIVCATPDLVLEPGTYWVVYSLAGTVASGPWGIPVTINGQLETGNAMQLTEEGWNTLEDSGTNTNYGVAFIIEGDTEGPDCDHGELIGYNVYRNNVKIGETVANLRTYMDANVNPGTYTYGVSAVYGQPYPGESEIITREVEVEAVTNPVITVNPASLYQYFFTSGDTETQVLTIGNTGDAALDWSAAVQYTSKSVQHPPVPEGPVTPIDEGVSLSLAKFEAGGAPALPESREDIILHYDGENDGNAIGLTGGGEFYIAARFPASMISAYSGFELKEIDAYINGIPTSMTLYIWDAGTTTSPGNKIYQQQLNPTIGWNSFNISSPIILDGNDIWVGYHVVHADGVHPAGCDAGPANPNGDWISMNGNSWDHLAGLGLNYNWNIRAKISGTAWLVLGTNNGTVAPGANQQINVHLNASGLDIGEYTANILISSNDPDTPIKTVPVKMDIGVGLEENDMVNVQVYPVPANSILFIDLVEGVRQIRMINIMGQIVKDETVSGELHKTLDLSGLRTGTYSLQFINNKGETHHKHIIISK